MSRRWVTYVVGALVTVVWVAIAGIGGPYFGRVGEVASDEQAAYLPSSAESTLVQKQLAAFFGDDTIPAVVVAERVGGLTADDLAWLGARSAELSGQVEAITGGVSPAIPSADGEAAQMFVGLSADEELRVSVAALRRALEGAPEGLAIYVTGAAGLSADLGDAFGGVDGLLLLVAVLAVLVILVAVYRSPLLPVMVLLAAMSALCAAVMVSFYLAKAGVFKMSGQVRGSSSSSSSGRPRTTRCCTSRVSGRRYATANRPGRRPRPPGRDRWGRSSPPAALSSPGCCACCCRTSPRTRPWARSPPWA
jgi:RND superfamily putative drug exporter